MMNSHRSHVHPHHHQRLLWFFSFCNQRKSSSSSSSGSGSFSKRSSRRKFASNRNKFAQKYQQQLQQQQKQTSNIFGLDLTEHTQIYNDVDLVPNIVKTCTNFIEKQGIIFGIYRLSGMRVNIGKLRQEFDKNIKINMIDSESISNDAHAVACVLKQYFRELPTPLLTFHMYERFIELFKHSNLIQEDPIHTKTISVNNVINFGRAHETLPQPSIKSSNNNNINNDVTTTTSEHSRYPNITIESTNAAFSSSTTNPSVPLIDSKQKLTKLSPSSSSATTSSSSSLITSTTVDINKFPITTTQPKSSSINAGCIAGAKLRQQQHQISAAAIASPSSSTTTTRQPPQHYQAAATNTQFTTSASDSQLISLSSVLATTASDVKYQVRLDELRKLLLRLPRAHYQTLKYLMRHLAFMASKGDTTGMDSKNVAIVWAPNLLKPPELSARMETLQVIGLQAVITEQLIKHHKFLFDDNDDQSVNVDHQQQQSSMEHDLSISVRAGSPTTVTRITDTNNRQQEIGSDNHMLKT